MSSAKVQILALYLNRFTVYGSILKVGGVLTLSGFIRVRLKAKFLNKIWSYPFPIQVGRKVFILEYLKTPSWHGRPMLEVSTVYVGTPSVEK